MEKKRKLKYVIGCGDEKQTLKLQWYKKIHITQVERKDKVLKKNKH